MTDALPPSVAALPQEVRDAMGRAIVDEIVQTLERMAAEGRRRMASEQCPSPHDAADPLASPSAASDDAGA
jgi:hypothetical protein